MKKFAVIDIGSNSVRLMLVADGNVLYKRLQTTRLGEGLADSSCLQPQAIERSAHAVATFNQMAIADGAQSVFAFATAAVRTAKNSAEFLSRVQVLCGLSVEVIAGETEAEIGVLGALGNNDGGILDIGGASTEILVKTNGQVIYKKSVDIGVVRLKDKCAREKDKLVAMSKAAIKEFGEIPQRALYAIGGTATTLAALHLGLLTYDSDKVTGAQLTVADVENLADRLLSLSVAEIAALPCIHKGREDVITGGAVLLATLMQELRIEKVIVSDRDNLEGYAIMKKLM